LISKRFESKDLAGLSRKRQQNKDSQNRGWGYLRLSWRG
jgi:hypothetical protein